MLLFLPYAHTSTNCYVHQLFPAGLEDLKRKVYQSDRQVTWTTRDIYKKVERMEALLQASSTPLPQSFLMHLVATTSSQSASEFLHWFITFSQPPLVFSLVLDPSISLIPFFFFPTGHDRLSICPHSFLLLCSRQMEKLMITLAKASFAALNNRSTEKHISRKFKPNVSLNQTKQFGLPVQYMCHLHFQNSVLKGFRTVARWCGTV